MLGDPLHGQPGACTFKVYVWGAEAANVSGGLTYCHSSAILNKQVPAQQKFSKRDELFSRVISALYCYCDKLPQI